MIINVDCTVLNVIEYIDTIVFLSNALHISGENTVQGAAHLIKNMLFVYLHWHEPYLIRC